MPLSVPDVKRLDVMLGVGNIDLRLLHVFTSLETRKSPHQNWTIHRDDPSSWRGSVYHNSSGQRTDPTGSNEFALPPLELWDEPQRNWRRTYTPRPSVPDRTRYSHQPYAVTPRHTIRMTPAPRVPPNRPAYNSFPPWYADKYRRMPRDESDGGTSGTITMSGVSRLPWNYQPRCRSCGRPMLQDSFCSDDFGKWCTNSV
ncbi:unnamed protein product [Echinostoma caproni]|uniref:LITAF domain-containing protein n=1 Tax=Echinostoma caproni TaxID=27848 RepID=A0A183A7F2_9TREM|nr:unnamed protein product [Echinostoma caproni]